MQRNGGFHHPPKRTGFRGYFCGPTDMVQSDTSACIIAPKSSCRTSRMSPEREARPAKKREKKKEAKSSTQSHLAVNPFSRSLNAFARTYDVFARAPRRKSRKNFAPYVVTRDEHRGRKVGGRRGNDLVACRANWPWSFLIRSIYRTRRVFRPLARSLSTPLSRPFISPDAILFKMKCRGFINLYLPPKAFCSRASVPNYIMLPINEPQCVFKHSCRYIFPDIYFPDVILTLFI